MSTLGEENRLLQAVGELPWRGWLSSGGRRCGTTQGRSDGVARMREASKGGLDGGEGLCSTRGGGAGSWLARETGGEAKTAATGGASVFRRKKKTGRGGFAIFKKFNGLTVK